jgi:hypothetical protein
MSGSRVAAALIVIAGCMAVPAPSAAQSAAERDALVRLRVDRGGRAEDVDALLRVASEAGTKGLPVAPLTSKIREGLSKGADPARIDAVIRQMAQHLETADRVIRESQPAATQAGREASVTLLADALGGGVTVEEVTALRLETQAPGRPPVSTDLLAGAAKGLSFIKDVKLPLKEGTAVMAEAVRQGFRQHEVLDLGREIKRRERDYREGRASLVSLREAIARGSRPDSLFRDSRAGTVERPAATRPEPATTRPEPVTRPERPQPAERPTRPERPAGTTR